MYYQLADKEARRISLSEAFYTKMRLQQAQTVKKLKIAIWAYFLLVIFEGALRKWILPGLASPLLLIRDPIALWIVYVGINRQLIQGSIYVWSMMFIGIISFFTAITLGHGNALVALYGMRAFVFHFPTMFVMAKVLTKDDVIQFGKATLLISIGMAVLTGLQFFSPQTAWVNRGVGGDETGAGFSGALGYFRPPGTFSFTNGNTAFFSFAAPFIFFFWLASTDIKKWILILATFGLLAAIPFSISRALFFSVCITAVFAISCTTRNPRLFGRIFIASLGILVTIAILSQVSFFQTATSAFTARFTGANESEGGLQGVLVDRYLGGMVGAIRYSYQYPFFGLGIGFGTNVGGALLKGKTGRYLAEGDWGRTIGEIGLLLGLFVVLIRIAFSAQYLAISYQRIKKGNLLPWMLFSFGIAIIPQGEWAQATSLGFSTLIGGFILAALNDSGKPT